MNLIPAVICLLAVFASECDAKRKKCILIETTTESPVETTTPEEPTSTRSNSGSGCRDEDIFEALLKSCPGITLEGIEKCLCIRNFNGPVVATEESTTPEEGPTSTRSPYPSGGCRDGRTLTALLASCPGITVAGIEGCRCDQEPNPTAIEETTTPETTTPRLYTGTGCTDEKSLNDLLASCPGNSLEGIHTCQCVILNYPQDPNRPTPP